MGRAGPVSAASADRLRAACRGLGSSSNPACGDARQILRAELAGPVAIAYGHGPMDLRAYLARIEHAQPEAADLATLRTLMYQHLLNVPFENLDIALGQKITLERPRLERKIVKERRGGFCYELNGLFAWLLRSLGYAVDLLSARVLGDEGFGPAFDHLLLVVHLEENWLVDVGFGDAYDAPLPWRIGEHVQGHKRHRIAAHGECFDYAMHDAHNGWRTQYRFDPRPRRLDDFHGACEYQQTSPRSIFTRKRVCTRLTEHGRVTIARGRWIVTEGHERDEGSVEHASEAESFLRRYFSMDDATTRRLAPLFVSS